MRNLDKFSWIFRIFAIVFTFYSPTEVFARGLPKCPTVPTVVLMDSNRFFEHANIIISVLKSDKYNIQFFEIMCKWCGAWDDLKYIRWAASCKNKSSPILGLNMSLTYARAQKDEDFAKEMRDSLQEASKSGILITAAAGNESLNIDPPNEGILPASSPFVTPICAYNTGSSNNSNRCIWEDGIVNIAGEEPAMGTSFAAPRYLKFVIESNIADIVCKNSIKATILDGSNMGDDPRDWPTMSRARYVCRDQYKSCLVKFIKQKVGIYSIFCGKEKGE